MSMDQLSMLLKADRDFSALSASRGAALAFKEYLLPEAVMLPNRGEPMLGIDRIYHSLAGDYTLRWSPQSGQVAASGDLGYTWGTYVNEYKNERGENITEKGKYLNIWVQKGGKWRVAVDMGNLT